MTLDHLTLPVTTVVNHWGGGIYLRTKGTGKIKQDRPRDRNPAYGQARGPVAGAGISSVRMKWCGQTGRSSRQAAA